MACSLSSAGVEEVAGNLLEVESVGQVEKQKASEEVRPKEKQVPVSDLEPLPASGLFFQFSVAERKRNHECINLQH